MKAHLLIIKHHLAEGPGRILHWAEHQSLTYKVIEMEDDLPTNVDTFSALIVLGGPMSSNEVNQRLDDEKTMIHDFINAKKPALGVCLGAQLIAQCFACEVKPMPIPENGWNNINFAGSELNVPQWHSDEIIANGTIKTIAHSNSCQTQAFIVSNHVLGFQFHPEWSAESITTLQQHFDECPLEDIGSLETQNHLEMFFFKWLDRWWHKKLN